MGQNDLSEKLLEDYNDVFADIVNGLIFKGAQKIHAGDLRDKSARSQYKADIDNKLHEQERDVVKDWVSSNVRIAVCGLENQTKPNINMPVRVFGYEGSSYRSQLLVDENAKVIPVITLVIYFGTERRWKYPRTLKEIIDIPYGIDKFVNDCRINVFEIAWLSDEEVNRFTSDFKVVANFFVNKRKNKDYIPDDKTEIKHVDEVLKLLSVMTGDYRYEEILAMPGTEVRNMCEVVDRLVNKGRAEGRAEGRAAGEIKLAKLMNELLIAGRDKDALKASSDEDARNRFYSEFGIE